MAYDIEGKHWSQPKRLEYIEGIKDQSVGKYILPVKFQGQVTELPVYRVPVEMPVYRLSNGRTLACQQEYLSKHNKPTDFFTCNTESIEALTAQDKILRKLVNDKNLYKFFKTNEQIEPLILDEDGYVINGNRRLCAYRMLLEEDPQKFDKFKYVRVVFLPHCVLEDINILEAALQIQEPIKADYNWVDEAILLRDRQHVHGWDEAKLAQIHGKKPKQVKELIDMLDHADRYLAEIGHPNEYRRVLDKQFAFKALRQCRSECEDEATGEMFSRLSYILLDNSSKAGDRLYERIPELYENLDEAKRVVIDELVEPSTKSVTNDGSGTGDDDLLGGNINSDDTLTVIEAVSKPENKARAFVCIKDVIESAIDKKAAEDDANYCLRHIKNANKELNKAIESFGSHTKKDGINAELISIEDALRKIRSRL